MHGNLYLLDMPVADSALIAILYLCRPLLVPLTSPHLHQRVDEALEVITGALGPAHQACLMVIMSVQTKHSIAAHS